VTNEKVKSIEINQQKQKQKHQHQTSIKETIKKSLKLSKVHGFSNLIESQRLYLRVMWIIFISASCGGLVYFVTKSIQDFLQYKVITQTEILTEKPMLFPAFYFSSSNSNSSIDKLLFMCFFDNMAICNQSSFESIKIKGDLGDSSIMYRFNGGKTNLNSSNRIGYKNGLVLGIYLENSQDFLNYIIVDNDVRPTYDEVILDLRAGQTTDIIMKKNIDELLESKIKLKNMVFYSFVYIFCFKSRTVQ
jgi:hypothetical protein